MSLACPNNKIMNIFYSFLLPSTCSLLWLFLHLMSQSQSSSSDASLTAKMQILYMTQTFSSRLQSGGWWHGKGKPFKIHATMGSNSEQQQQQQPDANFRASAPVVLAVGSQMYECRWWHNLKALCPAGTTMVFLWAQ